MATENIPNPRVEVYEHSDGQWGFRLRARNGQIIAHGEGYSAKSKATRAARRFLEVATQVLSRGAGSQVAVLGSVKAEPDEA